MIDESELCPRTLEWAARELESFNHFDLRGCMSKTKKGQREYQLRAEGRAEYRKWASEHIRAFQNRDDLSPGAILAKVESLDTEKYKFAHVSLLRSCWPLAWDGLVNIYATMKTNDNTIPPETTYRIEITKRGHGILSQWKAARDSGSFRAAESHV